MDIGDKEDEGLVCLLHKERFHREIVELALNLSPERTSNNDESRCWMLVREADLPIIIPQGTEATAKGI